MDVDADGHASTQRRKSVEVFGYGLGRLHSYVPFQSISLVWRRVPSFVLVQTTPVVSEVSVCPQHDSVLVRFF